MTVVITDNLDGTTSIALNFIDEGVILQGETHIKGNETAALAYLPFFEKDMRRNFADQFPLPESPEGGIEI